MLEGRRGRCAEVDGDEAMRLEQLIQEDRAAAAVDAELDDVAYAAPRKQLHVVVELPARFQHEGR